MSGSLGCEPNEDPPVWQEGPAYLSVIPLSDQPVLGNPSVTVLIQARGGNFVNLVTSGATLRYAGQNTPVASACASLPAVAGKALSVSITPSGLEALVEVTLYDLCGLPDGESAPDSHYCEEFGALVTSTAWVVRRSPWAVLDAGVEDGGPARSVQGVGQDATTADSTVQGSDASDA
jgi:hypothetical protein